MHEYTPCIDVDKNPYSLMQIRNWNDGLIWKIVIFSTIFVVGWISILFAEAGAIENNKHLTAQTSIANVTHGDYFSWSYIEKRITLKDGTPCVIVTGGHSGRLGLSCNWDWRK